MLRVSVVGGEVLLVDPAIAVVRRVVTIAIDLHRFGGHLGTVWLVACEGVRRDESGRGRLSNGMRNCEIRQHVIASVQ